MGLYNRHPQPGISPGQWARKKILNSLDPYLALLAYRTTPLDLGYSSAQLLFNRQLRGIVPVTPHLSTPVTPPPRKVNARDGYLKTKQKQYYDQVHGARALRPLEIGEDVHIGDRKEWGTVLEPRAEPRSYNVEVKLRRNRFSLLAPESHHDDTPQSHQEVTSLAKNKTPQCSTRTTPTRSSSAKLFGRLHLFVNKVIELLPSSLEEGDVMLATMPLIIC